MKSYPSQQIFATGSTITTQPHEDSFRKVSGVIADKKTTSKAQQEHMPYQVQLMSLANMNASNQEDSSRRPSLQKGNEKPN